ncbi:spore coat U domain-containing protein [Massilia sp. UMI-21]|nr:spore coat U domain-containing protein [Massilia sp. UMI-21]
MTTHLARSMRLLMFLCLLLAGASARADTCEASMTDISFGSINPIASGDVHASGTLTVTCTWTVLNLQPPLLLLPSVNVCVNLGAGSGGGGIPRYLSNGSQRLAFNLYTGASYSDASVWGGPAIPGTSGIPTRFEGLLKLGSVSRSFPVVGRIAASALAGIGTGGAAGAVYSSSFAGHGSVSFSFSGISTQPCSAGASTAFSFRVQASIANDCVIQAGSLDFGANSVLSGARRAASALSVRCTADNPYQVVLNGGMHGSIGARRMKNAATGETIAYTLSSSPDGSPWGDGTLGSSVYGGTGSGAAQSVPVYGLVPAQRTPSPGSYGDTVTATLYF